MGRARLPVLRGVLPGAVVAVLAVALAGVSQAAAVSPGSALAPHAGAAEVISTVAGGVGGPAKGTGVAIAHPCGVAFAAGRVYVAASGAVRALNPATGQLTTPAGVGSGGPFSSGLPLGTGGLATKANVRPCGATVDHSGNLVIADSDNNLLRVVAARTGTSYGQPVQAGHIYTVAGTRTAGFSGDGGPAASAEVNEPADIITDSAGNLVFSDKFNNRIRVVAAGTGTFYGQQMTAGDIYTIAGGGTHGLGDGGPATSAALSEPVGIAFDAHGNLVLADEGVNRIQVVAAATGTFYGQAMKAGDIYSVAGDGRYGLTRSGGPATRAQFRNPEAVTVDPAGNLVIGDTYNGRIRVVAVRTGTFYGQAMTAGDIYAIAGGRTRAPRPDAQYNGPAAITVDAAGNLVVAEDYYNRVRVFAASTGTFYGQHMKADHLYSVAGTGLINYSGDGGLATSAELDDPQPVAVDSAGNLLFADTSNSRIRVVAAHTGMFYGQAMKAGDIYTVAGGGTHGLGDGGPATRAELDGPWDVAVDAAGDLVITDIVANRVRLVAAHTGTFYGQAMKAGDIYTVAGTGGSGFSGDGGPASKAKLNSPERTAVDAAGNLVIADSSNQRIRVVAAHTGTFYGQAMKAGDIYSIAGNGDHGFSGDGGPATKAALNYPNGLSADPAGNLLIADELNNRIRVVAAHTGTFYGQAMKAGDIYSIVGNGQNGFSGDGGPAIGAELSRPTGVTVDAGNLVITDTDNNRIRMVSG